jgi:hypothetical protein
LVFPENAGQYDTIEVSFSEIKNTSMLAVVSDFYNNPGAKEYLVQFNDTIVVAYPFSLFLSYTAETLERDLAKFTVSF